MGRAYRLEDYYMNKGDYGTRRRALPPRLAARSNYLFMDWHVGTLKNRGANVPAGDRSSDPPVAERQ